jgi:hypothetical protein
MPDRLPLPQSLIMNPTPVDTSSDISVEDLYAGLPNSGSDFSVQYASDWDSASTTIINFEDGVFDNRATDTPYRYGAYEIYKANRDIQQYRFISFLNTTS